ncbi:MAG: hypothetical protein UY03_C0012G0005 [Parcubacteria group bacterium GW2011_GWA2_47_64]|nr:MAG: hypothetical protein UY03_C0012G0005 [Parcubacteria group bacterium GW2011_GWA2_47_64]KKU96929.1 MAG: hypothetical protein UY29_C0005G0062 [Parcubacteria group bacterium GW2011_GWC2_48_17]
MLYNNLMSRTHLLVVLAVLVCVIAALQFTALTFHLYWTFWWYDIIVHFLGGTFSGLLILWLCFFSGYFGTPRIPSKVLVFWFIVLSALAVGIGWEVFERALVVTSSIEGYYLDTILDVIFDVIGGIVAFRFFISRSIIYEVNA